MAVRVEETAPEREDLSFPSGEERCAAWLYRPAGAGPHPLVILGHGFAGTREGRLADYAERFRDGGLAALVFDYRYFGDSTGEPRQLLSMRRRHDDWRAAIAYARTLEDVDRSRIALWGTSLGGGHVVEVAAGDHEIAAVIAQAPFASGIATLGAAGVAGTLRLAGAAIRDAVGSLLGREPFRIPAVGRPGETAAMTQPGSYEGYLALFDEPAEFRNEYCARAGLTIGTYMPTRAAPQVECPLLVLICGADAVTPPDPARRMAERAPRGESVTYEGWGHFEIYVGERFERTIADQVAFLRRTLID